MAVFVRVVTIFFLFLAIVLTWLSYPEWLTWVLAQDSGSSLSNKGTIGDAYGALNTLFSGLAFAGIIISIVLQSSELKETRKEIKEQKDQFVIQNSSLKKQVFENTFFQLLHLHNEITDAIVVREKLGNREEKRGRAAFTVLINVFIDEEHHHSLMVMSKPNNRQEDYELFHQLYHDRIGHYFRNIYQVLKFIDTSELEQKQFYANLLRAQLSSDELALLFYNCLSHIGNEKFKPLLEKYAVLEHLPPYGCITSDDAKLYHPSVFGTSKEWKRIINES